MHLLAFKEESIVFFDAVEAVALPERRTVKRARRAREIEVSCCKSAEAERMQVCIDNALRLAQRLLLISPRLQHFRDKGILWKDQVDLLDPLIRRRANSSSSLGSHVRAVSRFLSLANASGTDYQAIRAEQLAVLT